jgi:hypothetical protein
MTTPPRRIGLRPLLVGTLRQGSPPAWDETRAHVADTGIPEGVARGSGRRLGAIGTVPLARRLEPGRTGNGPSETTPAPHPIGWNKEFPSLPGRGARGQEAPERPPAITLLIRRSMCGDIYHLHVQMMPRDEVAEAAIRNHYIAATVTYLDRAMRREWEAKRYALIEESAWRPGGRAMLMSPVPVTDEILRQTWVGIKRWWHASQVDRGLEVTVDDLLGSPYPIWSDDYYCIREIERSIIFAVDAIALAIEVGIDFSQGVESAYAPGASTKATLPRDDGTPPSGWGS